VSESVKQTENETKGVEYALPCVKCAGKTHHKALASIDVRGEEESFDFDFAWITQHQIIQCQGCKSISFREQTSTSEDHPDQGLNETLYPSRLEGRRGLGQDVRYLPLKVRGIYNETLQALVNLSPILAGIGLRALLETVCTEKAAIGKDLFKKIDNLVAQAILTPASAAILHKIRTLGNDAAHEVKPHTDKQLGLAMDVVEHLLRDVYILPKQMESEF